MFMISLYACTNLLRTWMAACKLMSAFCISIMVSLKLTLSFPSTNAFCMASDFDWVWATPSNDDWSTLEKSALLVCATGPGSRNPAAAAATRICANNPSTAKLFNLFLLLLRHDAGDCIALTWLHDAQIIASAIK